MSVINNVLKDLETRESRFTPIEIGSVGAATGPARDLKPLLVVTLLLLSLMTAGWIYLQDQITGSADARPAPVVNNLPEVPLPTVSAVVESGLGAGVVTDQMIGNQIIGLQIRETDDDMRMEFALRERVVVYLKERGENSFGYHLRDIESQIVAPIISDNRWIQALAITSSETGVDINFQTATDILVETRQNQVDGEPIWAIYLRKSVAPAVAESAIEITAGKPASIESASASRPVEVAQTPAVAATQATTSDQTPELAVPTAVVKLDIKSTNPNAQSNNRLEYAVDLINSRRYTDAGNLLLGLLGGVEDYKARTHLLALYNRQNLSDRFRRLVRESMARYPDDLLFRTEYARAQLQAADYRAVIQLFADDVSLNATQQALLAVSYQRLDEHENAIRYYQLALKQDARDTRNWVGLGISQEHSAALEDALKSYQNAGKLGNMNSRLAAFVAKRIKTLRQVLD